MRKEKEKEEKEKREREKERERETCSMYHIAMLHTINNAASQYLIRHDRAVCAVQGSRGCCGTDLCVQRLIEIFFLQV